MTSLSKYKTWNALYLKSRHEKKVAAYFEIHGVEFYLPLVKRLSIRSDRKKWVEEPLFRGYIFIPEECSSNERVFFTPGVVNYVRYDGKAAVIKQEELSVLQSLIEKGYHVEAGTQEDIEAGDKVVVLSGALKGMEGAVLQTHGDSFFVIAVEGIGQAVKVKVSAEVLKKIE